MESAIFSSRQELTTLIEKAFGAPGIVEALTPKVEVARSKLEKTLLRDMEKFADRLPANWSGPSVSEDGLTAPERSNFIEARQGFARDISNHLAHGLPKVSLGWLSNKASITFQTHLGGGTGEAAAHLIATTLASHGVESKVSGTQVTFSPPPHERRALRDFKEAVNDVVTTRRELLAGLGSK
jgi:hypothetical protein